MNHLHKTLLRQIAKSNFQVDLNNQSTKKLLELISKSYNDYDESMARVNNTLDVSLSKSFLLSEKIAEVAKNDFQSLVEGLPLMITWFDENLIYKGVNKAFESFIKYPADFFIGKHIGNVFGDNDSLLVKEFKAFAVSEKSNTHHEFEVEIEKSTYKFLSYFQKINNGKVLIIATIDMTEHYQLQEFIEKQKILAVKNSKLAAIGELAAGVAHEINNPLTVILSTSQNALKKIENEIKVESQVQLQDIHEFYKLKFEKIEKMSLRINKIVQGLKATTRDGSKDSKILINFKDVFQSAFELAELRLKSNGINFKIVGDTGFSILCEPVSISQVFLNLLNNSIDEILDHASPWIRLEIIHSKIGVELRFIDSGEGIKPEILEKIFQPFFTTKEVGKGTGLGLSISKTIIEDHGGTFLVDGSFSHTCFVVSFPSEKLQY